MLVPLLLLLLLLLLIPNVTQLSARCPNPLACQHKVTDSSIISGHPYHYTFTNTFTDRTSQDMDVWWHNYSDDLCGEGYRYDIPGGRGGRGGHLCLLFSASFLPIAEDTLKPAGA